MIRLQTKSTAEAQGFAGEAKFAIKNSSKAFKILSDNIYKDKIAAIIRELSCNAQDAHIDANNPEPFKIWLPTRLSPEFKIRDYGTGLPHEKVMTLYVTYFDSTKERSNDFAGTLGLGTKSPFSYVDTFTIANYYNGEKHLYVAYISQDSVPAILYQGAVETDAPNGLEISFPVQTNDIYAFTNAAERILYWMEPRPDVSPKLKFNLLEKIEEGTNWYTYSTSTLRGTYIKQGPIVYPLDIKMAKLDTDLTDVANRNLIVEVPMGAVDFEPGREQLNYDDITVANVQSALQLVRKEILEKIQAVISASVTPFAKLKNYQEKFGRSSTIRLNSMTGINDLGLTGEIKLVPDCKLYVYDEERSSPSARREFIDDAAKQHKNLLTIFDPSYTNLRNLEFYTYTNEIGGVTKFEAYMKDQPKRTKRVFICGDKTAVDNIVNQLGNPDVVNLNSVLVKTSRVKTNVYQLELGGPYSGAFKKCDHITKLTEDISSLSGYYILVRDFSTLDPSLERKNSIGHLFNPETYHSFYRNSNYFKILNAANSPKHIYVIRDSDYDQVKLNAKLVHFDEFLIQTANLSMKEKFNELVAYSLTSDELNLVKLCAQINTIIIKDNSTRLLISNIGKINNWKKDYKGHNYYSNTTDFVNSILCKDNQKPVQEKTESIRNSLLNVMSNKYPLIKYLANNSLYGNTRSLELEVVDYINLVDKKITQAEILLD
jgi:hypothetical protein